MASSAQRASETYRCPNCDGVLVSTGGTWGCTDCGYAPPHGAD